ncbi:MAG: stage II sporulation protein D [Clostridiales bacterium]|nr:stage II sporulation protein D [Clostridiales bacterium]
MNRKPKKLAKHPTRSRRATVLAALGLFALQFLLPLALVLPSALAKQSAAALDTAPADSGDTSAAAEADTGENAAAESTRVQQADTLDGSVTLTVLIDGETETMTLADYLWGVVAAEMPAAFQQEALNAQAIAARTYTLYRLENPSASHPEADICGDSTCCQAWMSVEERMAQWDSDKADGYAEKITQAVSSTDGLALYYGGEPILAAFHAISAGSTKSALEVWGQDIPYLQAVESPEGEDAAPNYYSTVSVDTADFAAAFSEAYPEADLTAEDCADWFGEETYDAAGLPVSIEIGGVEVETSQLRTLFDLRSATFTVECDGDTITFYVTGYGHGVGMSQYGANALAKEGKTAEEILAWYYVGAEVQEMSF